MSSKYDGMRLRELLYRFVRHSTEFTEMFDSNPPGSQAHYAEMDEIALELANRMERGRRLEELLAKQHMEISQLKKRLDKLEGEQ